MPNTCHSSSRLTVRTNQPNHKINTEPVTIPARVNTVMTNPCTLPRSGNPLFELPKQHIADQPIESTPVIINAESYNLPVHFINHSDRDVVVPKHTCVGAMEKVQESNQNNLSTNATPKPVSQHALSECLAHNDLLPSQRQSIHTPFKKTKVSSDPVLLISPVSHLYNIALKLLMLNPSSKDSTSSNLLNRKDESFVSPEHKLTWKELLTYSTTVHLKFRLQSARPKRTGQLYFLDCTLPPVLAKRLHISNHLALGFYDLLSPKNTSLIQTVTHACCHLAMNASEHPRPFKNPNIIP